MTPAAPMSTASTTAWAWVRRSREASMFWENSSVQADVLWCETGGGLLVDGPHVEPARRGGVFTQAGSGLFGVLVNLRGRKFPGGSPRIALRC